MCFGRVPTITGSDAPGTLKGTADGVDGGGGDDRILPFVSNG
ncbi:MAG: hypothetical protein ABIJ48_05455 [Actinomycetota bacterium]